LEPRRLRPVVFDSSFLMAVAEHPTAWFGDIQQSIGAFRPVILASVRAELMRLAATGDKRASIASVALLLVQANRFSSERDGGGSPDDEVISFALRERAGVATIDSDLAKRLRASKVEPVITLRAGRVHS